MQAKDAPQQRRALTAGQLLAVICLVGLALTGVASWTAARADRHTEERLLEGQSRRAASVLSTAIASVQQPLTAAIDVQQAAQPAQSADAFKRLFERYVGEDALYISASLWRVSGEGYDVVAAMGDPAALEAGGPELRALLDRALTIETPVVEQVTVGERSRIVYALADPSSGYVVYAERPIPADRRAPVDRDSAYADLDYAIYLGKGRDAADLTTTNVDPADLPLTGRTYTTSVPFGDTVLTLVTAPSTHLGSELSRLLPWLLLVAGLLVTGLTAGSAQRIVSARHQVDALFHEQRELFVRLQRALLPHVNPEVPDFEFASEYVAGGRGMDIGGDWYSAIATGADTFAFVVGDVSGHGIDAVAEMARARFTLRAYLVDGDTPQEALEKCASQFDIARDGHIVTVLVGTGDRRTGRLTMANAGHPPPILTTGTETRLVEMPVGPPLGTSAPTYEQVTLAMPPGSTIVMYTDGLVERRDEHIDEGLARLVDAVSVSAGHSTDAMVAAVLETMDAEHGTDDVALLVLRRSADTGASSAADEADHALA